MTDNSSNNNTKNRAKGFYWVKSKDGWQIARWYRDNAHRWAWMLIGETRRFFDSDFMQVNENPIKRGDYPVIVHPDENYDDLTPHQKDK